MASAFRTRLARGGAGLQVGRALIYGSVSLSGRGLNPQISATLNHCTVEPGGRAEWGRRGGRGGVHGTGVRGLGDGLEY